MRSASLHVSTKDVNTNRNLYVVIAPPGEHGRTMAYPLQSRREAVNLCAALDWDPEKHIYRHVSVEAAEFMDDGEEFMREHRAAKT